MTNITESAKTETSKKPAFPFVDLLNINLFVDKDGVPVNAGISFDTGTKPEHNALQGNAKLLTQLNGVTYELGKCLQENGYESSFHDDAPIFPGCITEQSETKTGKTVYTLKLQLAKSAAIK